MDNKCSFQTKNRQFRLSLWAVLYDIRTILYFNPYSAKQNLK